MTGQKKRSIRAAFSVEILETRRLLSAAFAGATHNAIAYDSATQRLFVAYLDTSANQLKSAYRDAAGLWRDIADVIDVGANVGETVTMTLDADGLPGVAYYHAPTSSLGFSRLNSALDSWSTPETADGASISAGQYPSLAFNSSNRPLISYYDDTHQTLRFVQRGASTWGTPVQFPNSNFDVGRHTSLKLNPVTNDWAIAYERQGNGSPNSGGALYVERNAGNWGTPATIASTDTGGGYTSLQYLNNQPAVSFYDAFNANLMYARKLSGGWTPKTIVSDNIQGRYTNLLVQGSGASAKARIVFQDFNSDSNSTTTVRVADEPTNWQTQAWDLTKRLYTGGGSHIKAAKVSDTEFFYTRTGDNPTAGLFVANSVNEGKNFAAKTTTAFSTSGVFYHASVVFPDAAVSGSPSTMWVLGGFNSTYSNDVYSSTDGATWTLRTTTTPFTARTDHAAVVVGTTMYVIGGADNSGVLASMYSSTNGVDWSLVNTTTALPARSQHTAVVRNGNIYVIGGMSATTRLNDVWKFNGTDWSQVTPGLGSRFTGRVGHASYVYDDKLWVVAGSDTGGAKNDIWYSADDGATWDDFTMGFGGFSARTDAAVAVFDNRMWILGGSIGGSGQDDAYWSTDGQTWTAANPLAVAGYGARYGHTSLVFNQRLWVIGGAGASGVGRTVSYAKNGEA